MEHLKHLTPDTIPGSYRIDTASGSTYLITITKDAPAVLRRTRTAHQDLLYRQRSLWGDDAGLELSDYEFTIGECGHLMFWDEDARNSPGYQRGAGPYAGTVRETTPVQQITPVDQSSNQRTIIPKRAGARE